MNLTATELNIFGAYILVASTLLHVMLFMKSNLLMTMHPKEADRLHKTVFVVGLGLYVLAVLGYLAS